MKAIVSPTTAVRERTNLRFNIFSPLPTTTNHTFAEAVLSAEGGLGRDRRASKH